MTVKYHTLEQKLERLKEQLIRLEEIKGQIKSAEDLKRDYKTEAVVERLFQITLEALLDIGRMIVSLENLPRPQENDEIFQILAHARVLSEDYAKRVFGMGRFRNILVHGYMIIEEKRVFENLEKLSLLKEFVGFVTAYLKEKLSSSFKKK